jgi:hypothetical protein
MSKATIGPLALALAFLAASPILAQPKAPASHDEFRKVDLHILPDQTLEVTETWRTIFPAGKFSVYQRWLPLSGLQGIAGVEVSVDGLPYLHDASVRTRVTNRLRTAKGGEGRPGFATWTQGDNFSIGICFPESSDEGRTFQIRYRVQGALRTSGSSLQLHWVAIGSEQAQRASWKHSVKSRRSSRPHPGISSRAQRETWR